MSSAAKAEADKVMSIKSDGYSFIEPSIDQLSSWYVAAISAVPAAVQAPRPIRDDIHDIRNVHHSKPRGLFGHFVVIKTVQDPVTYSRKTKWFITLLVAAAAGLDPIGSTIFYRQ